MRTIAQQIAMTLEDPETLGARWNGDYCVYEFPDGSAGTWETIINGAEQRDGFGNPVFHFAPVATTTDRRTRR